MTEQARSKNWLKNKNRLLSTAAIFAIGAAALTGCKASGEGTPTPPPTEQTQTQTPPTQESTTPTTPETTTPEVTESPETNQSYEFNIADSAMYEGLSSADKKVVDKALEMDVKEFETLDSNERNLVAYTIFDAGYGHYSDHVKDIQIDKWGTPSNNDGDNLLDMYHNAILTIDPWTDIVPKDWDQRVADGRVNDEDSALYIGDGYREAEALPLITEQLFYAVASDMAVAGQSKYHPNLKYAQMMMSGLYNQAGKDQDIAQSRMDKLETIFEDGYDPEGAVTGNWPDTELFSRKITVRGNHKDGRVNIVLVNEDRTDGGANVPEPGLDQLGDVVGFFNYNSDRLTTYTNEDGKKVTIARLEVTSKEDGSVMPLGMSPYSD